MKAAKNDFVIVKKETVDGLCIPFQAKTFIKENLLGTWFTCTGTYKFLNQDILTAIKEHALETKECPANVVEKDAKGRIVKEICDNGFIGGIHQGTTEFYMDYDVINGKDVVKTGKTVLLDSTGAFIKVHHSCEFEYDERGNETKREVVYEDGLKNITETAYDCNGNKRMVSENGELEFVDMYDDKNRVILEHDRYSNTVYSYLEDYDMVTSKIWEDYKGNKVVQKWEYNDAGFVTLFTERSYNTSGKAVKDPITIETEYHERWMDPVVITDVENGITEKRKYDHIGRLSKITVFDKNYDIISWLAIKYKFIDG